MGRAPFPRLLGVEGAPVQGPTHALILLSLQMCVPQHFFQDESHVAISCPVPSLSGLSLPAKSPGPCLSPGFFQTVAWCLWGARNLCAQVCHPRPCLHVGGGGLAVMQREASPAGRILPASLLYPESVPCTSPSLTLP